MLGRLLRNPVYIGKVCHNGNTYNGEHEGMFKCDACIKTNKIPILEE
jgi:hypothetical protein